MLQTASAEAGNISPGKSAPASPDAPSSIVAGNRCRIKFAILLGALVFGSIAWSGNRLPLEIMPAKTVSMALSSVVPHSASYIPQQVASVTMPPAEQLRRSSIGRSPQPLVYTPEPNIKAPQVLDPVAVTTDPVTTFAATTAAAATATATASEAVTTLAPPAPSTHGQHKSEAKTRPLRIYMYDLNALGLKLGTLQHYELGEQKKTQFATQFFVPHWLREDSRHRAARPEDADLFYVPLMAKVLLYCLLESGYWDAKHKRAAAGVDPTLAEKLFALSKRHAENPARGKFTSPQPLYDGFTLVYNRVITALRGIRVPGGGMSYFDRHGGRDHVFLWPSGVGPSPYMDWRKKIGNAIFLMPESGCSRGVNEVLQPSSISYSEDFFAAMGAPAKPAEVCVEGVMIDRELRYFLPEKDVVIPGYTDLRKFGGHGHFVDPSFDRARRPYLLQYCGDFHKSNERRIAQRIGDSNYSGVRVKHKCESLKMQPHSLFCLVPTGHSPWTLRFYEAVFLGCVPVLLNLEKFSPAFPSLVPWGDILVRFRETAAKDFDVAKLLHELERMAKHPLDPPPVLGGLSLAKRQELIKNHRGHLFYDVHRHDSKPNAFDGIMAELALRHAALVRRGEASEQR